MPFDPPTAILNLLGGGAVGAILTAWLTEKRDKRNRLRIFRKDIAEIRANLNDTKDEDLMPLAKATRSAVLVMCDGIREHLCGRILEKFDAARDSYCELEKHAAERGLAYVLFRMKRGTHNLSGEPIPSPKSDETRSRRQQMDDSLRELYECAT